MPEIRELKLKCKHCHQPLEIDCQVFDYIGSSIRGWIYCSEAKCGKTGYDGTVEMHQLVVKDSETDYSAGSFHAKG